MFDAHDPSTPTRRHFEDGWEDGEVHGASSSEGSDDEDDSSWLHGRYQSTDVMALQWGFAPALGTPPDLRVSPNWDAIQPSIDVTFEAVIATIAGPFGLEAILPPGWGWSNLQIRADGLFSWRSADLHGLGALVSATATNPDDSTETIEAFSPTLGGQGAMPNLAPLDATDFSFELNSFQDDRPAAPTTPSLRRIERHGAAVLKVVPRTPTPAAVFELEFERSGGDDEDDEDDDERVLLVEGTLVPLPMTLVSPDAPVSIPFFRFDDASLPTECDVKCAEAILVPRADAGSDDDDAALLCDTTMSSLGAFMWTDEAGARHAPRATLPVSGTVRVVVKRNIWGLQTVSIMLPWPAKAEEVVVGLSTPAAAVRVVRASARGTPLPHAVHAREEDERALADVRVGRGRGSVELVLEVADDNGVALPSFPGGVGEIRVELAGDGWESKSAERASLTAELLADRPFSNLQRTGERGFTGDLAAVPYITFAPASTPAPAAPATVEPSPPSTPGPPSIPEERPEVETVKAPAVTDTPPPLPAALAPATRWRALSLLSSLLSWNMVAYLVLFWILGSLAGQVARLRAEVAFIADEARDLRLYGFESERMGRAERAGRAETAERARGGERDWDSGAGVAGADAAITDPVQPQPTDTHGAHTSAPDTASDAADADVVDDVLEHGRKTPDVHAVAPVDGREYGLGRVVRGDSWDAWLQP